MRKCFSAFLVFSLVICIQPCKAAGGPLLMPGDTTRLLSLYEDTLAELQHEKVKPYTSDDYKIHANEEFTAMLKKALALPGSFTYPFDSLTTMARLTSPDKKFRVLNWNIPLQNGSSSFYGFIQSYNPKTKNYVVYELHDKGSESATAEVNTGTPDNWFGMLYYKIIPAETEKDTYIMLAWQGYSSIITRKIIDVITLNAEGVPSFGKAIFRRAPAGFKSSAKRIVFQYSAQLYMSLEYNEDKKWILFDHLTPPDVALTGQYQFYGPSFQVDALEYVNKAWVCMENVDARNMPSHNDKVYHSGQSDYKQNKKAIYTPH